MSSRVPDFVPAELYLRLTDADADAIERVSAVLRVFRVVGLVHDDDDARRGYVSVTVAAVPGRGLLVDTAHGVAPTPAQPIVDAVSARLRADVLFTGAGDVASAETTPALHEDAGNERDAGDAPTPTLGTLYVAGGDVTLAPDRRAELASQLESDLTVASVGDRVVIVAHNTSERVYWSRAQRPVIGLRSSEYELGLALFPPLSAGSASLRTRALALTQPEWMTFWERPPVPLVHDPLRDDALAAQAVLAQARAAALAGSRYDDAAALAALGIDGDSLADLRGRPLDPALIDEVVAALRLPSEVAAVVRGEGSLDDFPGSMRIENRGLRGAVSDAVFEEPEGDSVWARWRQLPHRHPGRAVALIAGEFAAAVAIAAVTVSTDPPPPWNVVLWGVSAVLAIDAIGDAVILHGIRRRRK